MLQPRVDGPAIIDCVVAADELPNVPHLELKTMENCAKAKIKEAILAVTGGVTENRNSAVVRGDDGARRANPRNN
jgi:hypothetical protein